MSIRSKRFLALSLVLILVTVSFGMVVISPVTGEAAGTTTISSRANDFTSTDDQLGVYYLGDLDRMFNIRVYNDYDGSLWNDNDPGDDATDYHGVLGNGMYLCKVKVSLEGITDENYQTVTDPLTSFDTAIFNGASGSGYNISTSMLYNHNSNGDHLSFDVRSSITPGIYNLMVKVTYYVRTSWWGAQGKWNLSAMATENEHITFEVRSALEPTPYDREMEALAYDNDGLVSNGGLLYCGASFQEIRIPVTAKGFTLTDITATLEPSRISLCSEDPAKIATLGAGATSYLTFRVDVPGSLEPQIISTGKITMVYNRSDQGMEQSIQETDMSFTVIIDYSPMFSPPDDSGHTVVATTVFQGTSTNDLASLTFTNTGNVPLRDIRVALDITNARFFNTGAFYYDEGADAVTRPLSELSVDIAGPLGPGATTPVNFPATLINMYLPLGYYWIPVTYSAWYFDEGELTGSTSWKQTTEAEYELIRGITTGKAEGPGIFLEVKDNDGLSAQASSNSELEQGSRAVPMTITVSNLEYYALDQVTYRLQNCPGLTIPEPELSTTTLVAASEIWGPGTDVIVYNVNVDSDAAPGIKSGELVVTGRSPSGAEITKTVELSYEITAIPALITVTGISTTDVVPGEDFDLEVEIMNIGGSGAYNLTVLLALNNNYLTTQAKEMTMSRLDPGSSHTLTFSVASDTDLEAGTSYPCDIYLKWVDVQGNTVQYSDNAPVAFDVRYDEPPCLSEVSVIGITTTHVSPGATFTLSVYLMNTGSATAMNITVMLALNNNLMSTALNTATMTSLASGASGSVTFMVDVDGNVEEGSMYTGEVSVRWLDGIAGEVEYNDNAPVEISMRAMADEPDGPIISAGAAILISGIVAAVVILLGAIMLFVAIMASRPKHPAPDKPDKSKDEMAVPGPVEEVASEPPVQDMSPPPPPPQQGYDAPAQQYEAPPPPGPGVDQGEVIDLPYQAPQ